MSTTGLGHEKYLEGKLKRNTKIREEQLRKAFASPETQVLEDYYKEGYYEFKYYINGKTCSLRVATSCSAKEFNDTFKLFQQMAQQELTKTEYCRGPNND